MPVQCDAFVAAAPPPRVSVTHRSQQAIRQLRSTVQVESSDLDIALVHHWGHRHLTVQRTHMKQAPCPQRAARDCQRRLCQQHFVYLEGGPTLTGSRGGVMICSVVAEHDCKAFNDNITSHICSFIQTNLSHMEAASTQLLYLLQDHQGAKRGEEPFI